MKQTNKIVICSQIIYSSMYFQFIFLIDKFSHIPSISYSKLQLFERDIFICATLQDSDFC